MQIYIDLKPELNLRELNKLIDQLENENLRHNIVIALYRIYIRSLGKINGILLLLFRRSLKYMVMLESKKLSVIGSEMPPLKLVEVKSYE